MRENRNVSIRLPEVVITTIKADAIRESMQQGVVVTFAEIIRRVLKQHIEKGE